jgi:hypothetical protein
VCVAESVQLQQTNAIKGAIQRGKRDVETGVSQTVFISCTIVGALGNLNFKDYWLFKCKKNILAIRGTVLMRRFLPKSQ